MGSQLEVLAGNEWIRVTVLSVWRSLTQKNCDKSELILLFTCSCFIFSTGTAVIKYSFDWIINESLGIFHSWNKYKWHFILPSLPSKRFSVSVKHKIKLLKTSVYNLYKRSLFSQSMDESLCLIPGQDSKRKKVQLHPRQRKMDEIMKFYKSKNENLMKS